MKKPRVDLDWARCRTQPFHDFQKIGVRSLVTHDNFALFDDMGLGKSWQAINAACFLHDAGVIDTCIVVAPASVRMNWVDPDLGQIAEHSFAPSLIDEFTGRRYPTLNVRPGELQWIALSYDLLRQSFKDGKNTTWTRIEYLEKLLRRRHVQVVFDESIKLKNPNSEQTKAAFALRRLPCVERAVLLNGTPITNSPVDLYAQFAVLDKDILGFKNYYHFRAQHCVMGGYNNKQIIKFIHEDRMNEKLAPYILRRLKEDYLDLLPKQYQVREVKMTSRTWKVYCEMRDEMVAWLDKQPSVCKTAGVKGLRLAQIASGFLGGVGVPMQSEFVWNEAGDIEVAGITPDGNAVKTLELSSEKQDELIGWLSESFDLSKLRIAIWCRFRPEMDRLTRMLSEKLSMRVYEIRGGQSKSARAAAMAEAKNGCAGRTAIVAQYQAGGLGLDFTSIHQVARLSRDHNLYFYLQAEDRHQRKGQLHQVHFMDTVACGPDGQKTIDHTILKNLRKKINMADFTTQQWRQAIING